jgi:hypothetical protein
MKKKMRKCPRPTHPRMKKKKMMKMMRTMSDGYGRVSFFALDAKGRLSSP